MMNEWISQSIAIHRSWQFNSDWSRDINLDFFFKPSLDTTTKNFVREIKLLILLFNFLCLSISLYWCWSEVKNLMTFLWKNTFEYIKRYFVHCVSIKFLKWVYRACKKANSKYQSFLQQIKCGKFKKYRIAYFIILSRPSLFLNAYHK